MPDGTLGLGLAHKSGSRFSSLRQPRSGVARIACNEACEVQEPAGRRAGTIWNLSILGAYVVLDGPMPAVNLELRLTFSLPADPVPIKVQGRVAWVNPASPFKGCGAVCASQPPGCGLEFLTLSAEDRDRIAARVREVRQARS
jgi:PilZ domain-containing protein